MTFSRPSFDEYYLAGAEWASTRADCTRSRVGALLVSKDHRVTPGYNGLRPGVPGCATAGNCPRGQHWKTDNTLMFGEELCFCGELWPCPKASAPDSDYSNCPAKHAEVNAMDRARPEDLPGATIYVTRKPCPACWTDIKSSGIARVVWPEGERGG